MDIPAEIRKQLNFIISSCRLYDDGRYEEAIRIAVAARVLFHNTNHSTAIIGGHHPAKNLKLLSTTAFKPGPAWQNSHFLGFLGLFPSIGGFKPLLDQSARKENIAWQHWWSREPIMALNKTQESITRETLILACANKDGGAHVDQNKPGEYERLETGLGIEIIGRFQGKNHDERIKLRYANLAALRQIGYESLSSEALTHLAEGS